MTAHRCSRWLQHFYIALSPFCYDFVDKVIYNSLTGRSAGSLGAQLGRPSLDDRRTSKPLKGIACKSVIIRMRRRQQRAPRLSSPTGTAFKSHRFVGAVPVSRCVSPIFLSYLTHKGGFSRYQSDFRRILRLHAPTVARSRRCPHPYPRFGPIYRLYRPLCPIVLRSILIGAELAARLGDNVARRLQHALAQLCRHRRRL
jgi:hypothetical protein